MLKKLAQFAIKKITKKQQSTGQTVKLEGDLTNRVVVDGTQFVGQIDELATVIQNNTFDAVAFSIDEATNGNIKIVRA